MKLRVDCTQDPDGMSMPARVWFGNRQVEVRGVVDRWYGTNHTWWKVETAEGPYVLRRDERTGDWELAAVVRE